MKIMRYRSFPVWLAVLAFAGMAFIADEPTNRAAETHSATAEDGQEIYMTRCLSCHMTNGEGVPGVFPPLAGAEYVTGDKGRLIRMVLNGLGGEITVKGTTYSGMMPPWGGALNDEQMAEVLTYVRSNFGNEADAVTADEVKRVRAHTSDRSEVWTIEELNEEENLGIPEGE